MFTDIRFSRPHWSRTWRFGQLYRDRGDGENIFDELKNQWGSGGFVTRDLARCPLAARLVALFYDWGNILVRLAEPDRHREAVTSRPLLLHAIAERGRHARLPFLGLFACRQVWMLVVQWSCIGAWFLVHRFGIRTAISFGGARRAGRGPSNNQGGLSKDEKFAVSAPSITLPKGGGAISGIGEKFAANPVTGTGSMTVPIFTSPGRSGFGPQLSLSYDFRRRQRPVRFWLEPVSSVHHAKNRPRPAEI